MQRPHGGKVAAIVIIAIWMVGAALLCWLGLSRWRGAVS
jgi:threonine/homoserine/homoserine lactone efflux protein